ncbi:zinc ribbon domain-containing protein [Microbacterium sp. 10M-3C3]|uniref:zinc ribbon domain-containing protein n=1 Tax=Microbacterium sp. 10M-3C3 TaxID=2483401 RepID=UPI0013DD92D3|nr:zinc ribbon domain-containing protein [Microbacterium sp. 10M-3C3]
MGGIARCGKCGAGLTITGKLSPAGDTRRYACQKNPSRPERGGLSINAAHLDACVTERVLHRLTHPRAGADNASTSGLLRQVVEINTRIGQLDQDYQDRVITRGEHRSGVEAATAALRDIERRLVTANGAIALYAAPIGNRHALQAWWDALDVTDRRAVITTLITRLRITPGRPGRSFDPGRVRITYRP